MRQPATGCNAPPAIVTAAAQFVAIEDVRSKTCGIKPIDYSYSLGYHVSPPFPLQYSCFFHQCPDLMLSLQSWTECVCQEATMKGCPNSLSAWSCHISAKSSQL